MVISKTPTLIQSLLKYLNEKIVYLITKFAHQKNVSHTKDFWELSI